jgi:hypothetical protein
LDKWILIYDVSTSRNVGEIINLGLYRVLYDTSL